MKKVMQLGFQTGRAGSSRVGREDPVRARAAGEIAGGTARPADIAPASPAEIEAFRAARQGQRNASIIRNLIKPGSGVSVSPQPAMIPRVVKALLDAVVAEGSTHSPWIQAEAKDILASPERFAMATLLFQLPPNYTWSAERADPETALLQHLAAEVLFGVEQGRRPAEALEVVAEGLERWPHWAEQVADRLESDGFPGREGTEHVLLQPLVPKLLDLYRKLEGAPSQEGRTGALLRCVSLIGGEEARTALSKIARRIDASVVSDQRQRDEWQGGV